MINLIVPLNFLSINRKILQIMMFLISAIESNIIMESMTLFKNVNKLSVINFFFIVVIVYSQERFTHAIVIVRLIINSNSNVNLG